MKRKSRTLFFIFLLATGNLFAQLPVCVKDINIAGGNSIPISFCVYNGLLYFNAYDGNKRNLYATDGTDAGTVMIKDSLTNYYLSVVNNKLVFFSTSYNNWGLFASDGTTSGTNMIYPSLSNELYGGYDEYKVWNNKLYFYGRFNGGDFELWVTDGTGGGTAMVKDIWPGDGDGIHPNNFTPIVEYGNKLYFAANDSVHGFELWSTNGTTAGTQMLKDIIPGTTNGIAYCSNLQVYNNKLYFVGNSTANGAELWSTDGTSAGTALFKDINPGTTGSMYSPDMHAPTFGIGNTRLLFVATDGVHGHEPWICNGTTAGTTMLKDIKPGKSGSSGATCDLAGIGYLFKFYFSADDSVHGRELWRTDGTTAGTTMIKDINPGPAHSHPNQFIVYHGKVYFVAIDATGAEHLWRTDGTEAGTEMVSPAIVTTPDPEVKELFVHSGKALYYQANYNSVGNELWKLDIPWYINTSVAPTAGGTATGGGGFYQGDAVNLVATPNANYNFVNWTENSVEVSTSPNYSFTCGQYDRTLVANFQLSVGVNELENNNNQIIISPNPATSEIKIHFPGRNISEIYIYDISGRLVLNIDNKDNSSNEITIDIESLQKGMYYMKVSEANTNTAYKFVKL